MLPLSRATTSPLSLQDAHIINAVLTLGYVLPLYLTKFTRLSFSKDLQNNVTRPKGPSERWRDDPAVIKARLLSVSASTIASVYLMHYILVVVQSDPLKVSNASLSVHVSLIRLVFTDWVGHNGRPSRVLCMQEQSPCPLRHTCLIPWPLVRSVSGSMAAFHDKLE